LDLYGLTHRTIIAHAVATVGQEFFREARVLEANWRLGRNPFNIVQMMNAARSATATFGSDTTPTIVIYDDAPESGWDHWWRYATIDLICTAPVPVGTHAANAIFDRGALSRRPGCYLCP